MCLILFAHQADSRYPLVVAANRDEFYQRPTSRSGWWEDAPNLLAGKDLQAGGTWMGVNRKGEFAALTNFRDPVHIDPEAPSRGDLVKDYLLGNWSAEGYLQALLPKAAAYNGYNLLLSEGSHLFWQSNYSDKWGKVAAGFHGLSNHLLDTDWPKVAKGKAALEAWSANGGGVEELFSLLQNTEIAPDPELPETGVSLEWERLLSPMFIESPTYGTRVSTVVMKDNQGALYWEERSFHPQGEPQIFEFHSSQPSMS
jgi:uncharacterized protein with NRDE domain